MNHCRIFFALVVLLTAPVRLMAGERGVLPERFAQRVEGLMAEGPNSHFFMTRPECRSEEKCVIEKTVDVPIWDVSVPAYSKELAEKYQLKPDFVMELPQPLEGLEFRLLTQGSRQTCNLNVLMKDHKGITFPEKEVFSLGKGTLAQFPKIKHDDSNRKFPSGVTGRELYRSKINSNYYWATADFDWNDYTKPGMSQTAFLLHYSNQSYPGYHYFSFYIGCASSKRLLEIGRPSLWFHKKHVPEEAEYRDQYIILPLPDAFVEIITPFIESANNSSLTGIRDFRSSPKEAQ